jgi:hypothetical protein
MRIRIGLIAGLVAAVLCASGTSAQSPSRPGGTDPACPPSSDALQLCLRYRPLDRLGRSIDPRDYPYQFRDPYLATITAAAMNPDGLTRGVRRQVVHVPVLPGRDRLPMLKGRGEASVSLYRQSGPAPLVFILGGIGSNPYFGLGTYYAALFHKQGAHVVVLPSPMSWNFALAASQSGAPGHAPDDARDVYRLMQATLAHLRSRYGVEATGVDFMGVSLGALEGAYLSVLDADEAKVGIRHYLLLNPPLDVSYALGKLNAWQALGATLGKERAARIGLKARGLIEDYIEVRRDKPNASFDRAAREFSRFSAEELQFIVAQHVRLSLPELVYVTQAIDDQGLLKAPRGEGRKRLQEAKAFTLKDYEEKIAVPRRELQEAGANGEGLNEGGSLRPILDRLRGNPRVHIMHNLDDILVERTAIEELKEIMGDQMTVYPYGGHLGNLWYAQNQEDILRFFRAPIASSAQPSSPGSVSSSRLAGSASSGR